MHKKPPLRRSSAAPTLLPLAASLMRLGRLAGAFHLASLPLLMAAEALLGNSASAAPRAPLTALPSTPVSAYGSANQYTVSGNALTLTQSAPTSIVNWKSFDIGAAASVTIVQPSASSVLLNNVAGGAYFNQTTIDGLLNANGRVYIYNPNGILFGKTAVVNVNTLVASTLQFDQSRVVGGFLQAGASPILGADPAFGAVPGAVLVDGDSSARAALTAARGGLILLAAPNVLNNGVLSAPDGQVMLAAGSKVYLAAPQVSQTGTSLRGLLVEVSNDYPAGVLGPAAATGVSVAENGVSGSVSVARGNATMIGYAVNQNGIVSATTSVSLNGSIYLYARDQALRPDANSAYQAARSGALTLGQNSLTQILPTLDDSATIAAGVAFNPSVLKLDGANIVVNPGAHLIAPGGKVSLSAERLADNNPNNTAINPATDMVRVDLAPGSVIDVSGSSSARLAMESNIITVNLRGTELADNVVLRNSPLYGANVQVDIRKGMTAANVSGWLNLVEQNIGQLNAAGGSVAINADGAILARPGSSISVNGGSVSYLAGYANTSKLRLNDGLVDVAAAASNVLYSGVVNVPNSAANYESGYVQGSSAGSVKFSAPILVLQGALSGQARPGLHQRDVTAAGYPLGGQLDIGNVSNQLLDPVSGKVNINLADQFGYTGTLAIGPAQAALAPAVGLPFDYGSHDQSLLAGRLELDPAALGRAGFNRLVGLTAGNIEVDSAVNFAPGGKLWLGAGQSALLNANGTLLQGGNISLNAPVSIVGGGVTATASGNLQVADGVGLDLAGRWINDRSTTAPLQDAGGNPVSLLATKGGSLNLTASALSIGNAVSVDVSAGAWGNAQGGVAPGNAGSIALQAAPFDPLLPALATLQLGSALRLSGYGFGSGGTLQLIGRNVAIGVSPPGADAADLSLRPEFFQSGGFANYDIGANINLSLLANTVLAPQASNWQWKAGAGLLPSGPMASVASPFLFALNGAGRTRAATNLTLRALAQSDPGSGNLSLAEGAQLNLDPGASVSLLAGSELIENGAIKAAGGHIVLGLTANQGVVPFSATRSIWLGAHAVLSAAATTQRLYISADGIASGTLQDGGTIQIGALRSGVLSPADGYVIAQAGSVFNVNGVYAGKIRLKSAAGLAPLQAVGSNGGSIAIAAREGLLFDGTLQGAAGGANATGGALTLTLDTENQNPGSYPVADRILNITGGLGAVVPAALLPGQAIVHHVSSTSKGVTSDLGWLLAGSRPGLHPLYDGEGWIKSSAFSAGGFGRLDFKSQNVLAFGLNQTGLTLSARDALILDAPILRADADLPATTLAANSLNLNAPYIRLGSADPLYQTPSASAGGGASSSGSARLVAAATTLDLIGESVLQGFNTANLNAASDLRLIGMPASDANGNGTGYAPGALAMKGNLNLSAAQIYPTTLSDFTLLAAPVSGDAQSGTLNFSASGSAAQPVLSAGASLTGIGAHIVQGGRLLAPFGAIMLGNLDPALSPVITSTLDYLPGSVTSVAGAGLVPFGTIANGSVASASDWQYALSDGTLISFKVNPAGGTLLPQRALPVKALTSLAGAIDQASGALLDLSGGGALFAYEFTAGKNGSRDILASNAPGAKATVFAINPAFHGSVAPLDGSYSSDGGLMSGDSVYLSAMPGLPAGRYTLLPAHYALLPGAFSISLAPNSLNMQASGNAILADGSMLVAGHLAQAGSGSQNSVSAGFYLSSGSVINTEAGYTLTDAGTYFKAKASAAQLAAPALPQDAGRLAFEVSDVSSNALLLHGTTRLAPATGGRSGEADFSAPQMAIVSSAGQDSGTAVKLLASELSALGADSVLLGALRSEDGSALHLRALASSVTLDNDAAHVLSGAQIVLAASDSLTLTAGAALTAQGTPDRAAQNVTLDGPGALLVASGGPLVSVSRSQSGATGKLTIASGASVAASGSLYLDATGSAVMNGQLNLTAGGALGIGAPQIALGSAIPAAFGGLQFGTAALSTLSTLSQLRFNSYGSALDLYGTVNLGSPAMRTLALSGAGLQGVAGDTLPQAIFMADTVSFEGQTAAAGSATATATATATPGPGSLSVLATTINLGSNTFAIHGYSDSRLSARSQIQATGSAGLFSTDQNLTLSAPVITTASGADASVVAGASLQLLHGAGNSAAASAPGLGGQLRFQADSINSDTSIVLPSGQVLFSSTNGIAITGGQINTAAAATVFGSTSAYAPGGSIELHGASVQLAGNALLDVSSVGAAAGTLSISANNASGTGALQLDGVIRGAAQAGADGVLPAQGQFKLDLDQAAASDALALLNTKLNQSGFTEARQITLRQGDIRLAGSDRIVAHQVMLAADNGNISLSGAAVIDASGPKGGVIELYASQANAGGTAGAVFLSDSAALLANATASATDSAGSLGNGGRVLIGSGNADGSAASGIGGGASIHLDGGSINVSGSTALRNGSVTLRAPQAGSEVAVASVNSSIINSKATVIEAYKVYTASTISAAADSATNLDATTGGLMYQDASSFIASSPALARLANPALNLILSPGLEVRASGGDLTLSVNELAANPAERGWDLSNWRFNGAPLMVTLRAAGNLNVLGSISDGFIKPSSAALSMPDWQLGSGPSASLRLVGGASLAQANPLAVIGGAGDVVFGFAARTPSSAAPLSAGDAPVALVRTGSGRIDVAAGRDINLNLAPFFTNPDGTPVIYDAQTGSSYAVSVFGASVYTAGQALPLSAQFVAPLNALNPHYGAPAGTVSAATFGSGGGGISMLAGRDLNAPLNAGSDWFYRNADGTAADPTTTPATAATPGTKVMLAATESTLVNAWLFRQGRSVTDASGATVFETLADGSTLNTAWWSRYDYFNQALATLGGGDVSVRAGGKISNLGVSVASNAYLPTGGVLHQQGGGDLLVHAGGDILGGAFYVQKGSAKVHADGAIGAGSTMPGTVALNPVLALGEAQFTVSAGHNLALEASYNPTLTEQSINNVAGGDQRFGAIYGVSGGVHWDTGDMSQASVDYRQQYAQFSNFSTYTADSAVHLASIGGSVLLSNNATALAAAGNGVIPNLLGNSFPNLYLLAPATFSAAALSADLRSQNGFTLMPAAQGQLDLLAARGISLSNGVSGSIRMLDNDPNSMSGSAAPRVLTQTDFDILSGSANGIAAHVLGGLHAADSAPAHLIALAGDILGDASAATTLALPKAAQISAGRDIVDLGVTLQHSGLSDLSSISAGRDVIDTTQAIGLGGDPSPVKNSVTGAGLIQITAGRNVDFGNGSGLVTRGNLDNPFLPEGGASIMIVAGGAQANYASFVDFASRYGSLRDVSSSPATLSLPDQADLMAYLRSTTPGAAASLTPAAALTALRSLSVAQQSAFFATHTAAGAILALIDFVRSAVPTLAAGVSAADAWVAFHMLPAAQQERFLNAQPAIAGRLAASAATLSAALLTQDQTTLNQLFFAMLVENSKATDLTTFDAQIASLFPRAATASGGDIALFSSQVKTEQGGSIDLLAPTGSVYAGLTTGVSAAQASTQGVFTIRGGAIRALVKDDFQVNQGRVFTLGGGDITLVSQYANIDAGRGAKTASSAPPPLITIDANGNIKVDVSGSIAGSGIATLKTHPDQPDSNVYPIAPRGIFDAGDAGVRSSGSVEIVAHVVLNGGNISAGGAIAGAAATVAAPALASVAAPSNAAPRSDDAAKALSGADGADKSGVLAVEVLGYGEQPEADAPAATDDDSTDAEKKKQGKSPKTTVQKST